MTHPDADMRRRLFDLVEGATHQAEASLRLLIVNSPAAMVLVDGTWHVQAASSAFGHLLGLAPAGAVGFDLHRRFTSETEAAGSTALALGLLTGGTSGLKVVCPVTGADGTPVWTAGTWHPLRLEGQERPLVVWQCRILDGAPADGMVVEDLTAGHG